MVEVVKCENCGDKIHKRPKPVVEKRGGQICTSCWEKIKYSVMEPEEAELEFEEEIEEKRNEKTKEAIDGLIERLEGEDEGISAKERDSVQKED